MNPDLTYKLLKSCVICLGKIPKSISRYLSGIFGMLWYNIDKRHRNIVLDNLEHAYGMDHTPHEIRSLAKRIFKNIANIVFTVTWSYTLTKKDIPKYFDIQGLEHLEAARAKGRGVLLLGCHIGNFELMPTGYSLVPYDGYGVYRPLDFEPLDRLILEFRERYNGKLIPIRGAGKKINDILRRGGIVGTLLDQSVDWYEGVFVNFFGRRTCTNKGVAVLAMRTRAAVVPIYIFQKNGRHILRFDPELPLMITGDRIKDIETNTQTYVSAIEAIIRKSPEHWFWIHNRWKTKPFCLLPPGKNP